ncbi:MAG: hypothetical protein PGMFKBFP_01140 [Anaerolineales bacterium]|nr:hypothetical protein [Anaerolineales bacterium]
MMAFFSSQPSAFSRLAFTPRTAFSVKARVAPIVICICSNSSYAITGIITFNSNCPAWAASATVVSHPATWNIAMSSISAITGLTLPGMMLEPGCTAGSWISSSPVAGPEASRRKSLAMRINVSARVLMADENAAASDMDCIDSNRLSDVYSLSPVNSDNFFVMRT